MSNLTINPQWHDAINQVEKDEFITGGADGNANLATRQLAENLFWLKNYVMKMPNSPTDGNPTTPGTNHTYTITTNTNPVNANTSTTYTITSSDKSVNEMVTVTYYQSTSTPSNTGTAPNHYATTVTLTDGIGNVVISPPLPQEISTFPVIFINVDNGKGSTGGANFNISQTQIVIPDQKPIIHLILDPNTQFTYPLNGGSVTVDLKYRSEIHVGSPISNSLTAAYDGSNVSIAANIKVFLSTSEELSDGTLNTTLHEMPSARVTLTGTNPTATVTFDIPNYSETINGADQYRLMLDGDVISVSGTEYGAIVLGADYNIVGAQSPSWIERLKQNGQV